MVFSRYLYEKIQESTSEYVSALLDQNELEFLDENHIHYYRKNDSYYVINSNEAKALFCHC